MELKNGKFFMSNQNLIIYVEFYKKSTLQLRCFFNGGVRSGVCFRAACVCAGRGEWNP